MAKGDLQWYWQPLSYTLVYTTLFCTFGDFSHLLELVIKLTGMLQKIKCSLAVLDLPVSPEELVAFFEPIVEEHTYALQCHFCIIQLCLHLQLLMLLAACHCACAHTEG